uniref:Cadherin N-terminal domain-containing protein n=1 Tax=Cyprinus carpio carpio TaxID=630221 RepID=A0A9J7YUD3_CYPCA
MEPKARLWLRYVSIFVFIAAVFQKASAVTHYTIPEEMDEGTVVANLVSDLGLDLKSLSKRKIRLDVVANKKYLDVNKDTGELYILERIDRENLCPIKSVTTCLSPRALWHC